MMEYYKNCNYGNLFIIKSTPMKQQIIFKININIFPKEILAENIRNKYILLSVSYIYIIKEYNLG